MPALANFGGDDDIRQYCTPRKRSRFSSPFSRGERKHHPEQEPRSLDSLPDECLYEILKRLPGNQSRSNSACVSKRWLVQLSSISPSELSSNDKETLRGCITRCLEGREVTDVRLAAISVGSAGHGGLGKLSIRGSHPTRGLTDLGLSALARCCPSLKSLSMWNVPRVSDKGLSEIATGCSVLETIDICECPLISDKGLTAIGKLCPRLESVSINDCPLVGDAGIAGLMSSAGSTMTKLNLQNLNVSDLALACIGHYGKAVTKLCLTGLQSVAERGFWCMGNATGLQKLKSISITSCRGVTDAGLGAVAKGCPSLNRVCLRKCSFVSDAGLKAFGSLEKLVLEECHRVSLVGVLVSRLKVLSLVRCFGVRDIGSCPVALPLQSLTIRDCPGFTGASLAVVGRVCAGITRLDLGGLAGVTDSEVYALVKEHGETLRVLKLDGCGNLSDSILLAISEHCDRLEELDMSRADVTDYGVALLASARCLNIRVLSLSGCLKVTPRSLPLLGNMGTGLVGLNLQQCNLTSQSVASLEKKMWWCDILF